MATKAKTTRKNPDKACQFPANPSCPFNSGSISPYRYQLGCRGEACKSANREYYRRWRLDKVSSNGTKKVPVKKAKAKAPVKKVVKKKTAKK